MLGVTGGRGTAATSLSASGGGGAVLQLGQAPAEAAAGLLLREQHHRTVLPSR